MIKKIEAILLFSDNPRRLAEFYQDKVGLKMTNEFEMGEENEEGFAFEELEGCSLYISHHSKVRGKNTQHDRIMFNLEVDDIEVEVKRLEGKHVKKVQDIYHVEGYGQIATYEDPDGNYFQLVQVREAN